MLAQPEKKDAVHMNYATVSAARARRMLALEVSLRVVTAVMSTTAGHTMKSACFDVLPL